MNVAIRALTWELALGIVLWLLAPHPREVGALASAPQAYVDRHGADKAVLLVASVLLVVIGMVVAVAVASAAVGELADVRRELPIAGRWARRLAALMLGLAVVPATTAACGPGPADPRPATAAAASVEAGPTVIDQYDWPSSDAAQQPPATSTPVDSPAQPPSDPPASAETPETAAAEPAANQPGAAAYTVSPGDCLWSIATALLPPGSSLADIADAVDDIWQLNAELIGSDPDLVRPHQTLQLPPQFTATASSTGGVTS